MLGEVGGQISAGEGSANPKTTQCPLPRCTPHWHSPLLGHTRGWCPPRSGREGGRWGGQEAATLLQTTGYLHQILFTEGACGGGGAHILGATFRVLSCQCQPRWGRLGLGVTLFPPPAVPLLTPPSTWGGADSSVMEWAGMQESSQRLGCTGRGVRVTPPTCSQTLVLGGGRTHSGVGGVNGPCPSPQIDHVAQFSRLPVASLLFILSGTRAGDL